VDSKYEKVVMLALPFGQTVRDVLRGDTFEELTSNPNIKLVIVSTACECEEFKKEFSRPNVEFEILHDYKPNRFENLLQSLYLSTLSFRSSTIRFYAKNDKRSALRIFIPLTNCLSKVLGRFRLQRLIGKLMFVANSKRDYERLFDKHSPDAVVVTRVLRGSPDYPILKEAARRELPTMALASSWDNFTTKGFFPFGIDRLVVWNHVMKQEAIELFGFPEENIFVSGIPRFDNYFNSPQLRSKEEFFQNLNIDEGKKLITYSTGNKSLYRLPGEPKSAEVEIVARMISALKA